MTPSKDRRSENASGSNDAGDKTVLEPFVDGDRTVIALAPNDEESDRTVLVLGGDADAGDRTILAPEQRLPPAKPAASLNRTPPAAPPLPQADPREDEDRTIDLTPAKRAVPVERDETIPQFAPPTPSPTIARTPGARQPRTSPGAGATVGPGMNGDREFDEIPPIEPGTLLGHTFEIERVVARGGMGEVFRAKHIDLGTTHAIKVILPELVRDSVLIDLFRREASVLRQVRHDAVVAYDGVNRDELGRMFLVMEFVDGPSLTSVLLERTLTPDEAIDLLDRVAAGLAAAHEKGVVHRDMSPDNIILSGGRIDHAKIIDFGIAKQTAPNTATIIGQGFAGRYAYASPEQIGMYDGQVDARSDIYSLALVIITSLLGKPLDMGDTPSSMLRHRSSVPDLSMVPDPLRSVLIWMLQPDPNDRPASMAMVIGAARARAAAPEPRVETPPEAERKRSIVPLIAAAGAVVLIGGGVGAWLTLSSETPRPEKPVARVEAPVPTPQPAAQPEKPVARVETPAPTPQPAPQPEKPVARVETPVPTPQPAPQPEKPVARVETPVPTPQPTPQPEKPVARVETPVPTPQPATPPEKPVARVETPAPTPQPATPPEKPVARVETPAPTPQPAPQPEKPVARVETPVPTPQPATPPEKPVARVETPAPTPQPAPQPEKPVARVETPAPTPQPAEKPITLEALRSDLDGARKSFRCSGLRVENDGGRLALNGYTASVADTETLRSLVGRLRLPAPARFNVTTEPPLLCQAMEATGISDGLAVAPEALRVDLNKESADYVDGETIRVTVNTAARAGYLNVDYFDPGDNSVVHMIPMPLRKDGKIGKNMTLVLGGDPKTADASTRVYGVSAPFGPGLILAVLTPKQLFPAERAERDADGVEYIKKLRAALGRSDREEVAARAVHFTTRPK